MNAARTLAFLLPWLACSAEALMVSGNIVTTTTWRLTDSPVVVTGNVTVVGVTLNVDPGVVVKFNASRGLIFSGGALRALGGPGQPIFFTSIKDDSVGGDTNGDGSATSPVPGDWGFVRLDSSASSATLINVHFRYGGSSFVGPMLSAVNGSTISLTGGEIAFSRLDGMQSDARSVLSASSVAFHGNLAWGFNAGGLTHHLSENVFADGAQGARIAMPQTVRAQGNLFKDLSILAMSIHPGVTLNGFEDTTVVRTSTGGIMGVEIMGFPSVVTAPAAWVGSSLPFVFRGQVIFNPGASLTVTEGAVVKALTNNAQLLLGGGLDALGSPAKPITFTSLNDDSVAGDTNGDGSVTSPVPGNWGFVRLDGSASSGTLINVHFRYGGSSFVGTMLSAVNGSTISLTGGKLSHSQTDGIKSEGSSMISVSSVSFNGNLNWGLNVIGGRIPLLAGNTFTGVKGARVAVPQTIQANGNTFEDLTSQAMEVHPGVTLNGFEDTTVVRTSTGGIMGVEIMGFPSVVTAPAAWVGSSLPFVFRGQVIFNPGASLTVTEGAVVKALTNNAQLLLGGGLDALGSPAKPITFTSLNDDSVAGDTNGDGSVTSPVPGNWGFVRLDGSASSATLINVHFRYGGSSFVGPMLSAINGSTISLTGGELSHSQTSGIDAQSGSVLDLFDVTISSNRVGVFTSGAVRADVRRSSIYGNSDFGVQNNNSSIRVSAQFNWWGSSAGPVHSSNPGGAGDRVSDFVDFIPFFTAPDQVRPPEATSVALLDPSPTQSKTVRFRVKFSNRMDVQIQPTATYSLTSPFDAFAVGSGTFLSPISWEAAAVIPSTAPDGRYFLRLSDARDEAGAALIISTYPFYAVDNTPPQAAVTLPAANSTVSRPLTVTASAEDANGAARVVFDVDGVALATATAQPFVFFWDTRDFSDGPHTLRARAFDTAGNLGAAAVPVIVSYAPPAAPRIASPADGFATSAATISVSGAAERGTKVQLLVNSLDVATASVTNLGAWSLPTVILPAEGEIALTAVAFEPRGFSGPSAPVRVTYTTRAPNPPILVQTALLSNGRAKISWQAGPGKAAANYHVYRSTNDLNLIPGTAAPAALRVASGLTLTEFTDAPLRDDLYFYAVTARDGAGNESLLSDAPYALVDRVAPSARVSMTTMTPLGPGLYPFTLTLSEVLSAVPVLTFTPQLGSPQAQTLTGVTGTVWRGTLTVTGAMNPGMAAFAFEGRDLASNLGTTLTAGAAAALDTRGPVAVIALSRPSPINADVVGVTLSLDERAISTPSLSWTANGAVSRSLSVSEAGGFNGRTWTAALSVAANTPQGTAVFRYSATDALGNVATELTGVATSFIVDTIAPNPPILPRANPGPGGAIDIAWSGNAGELPAHYRILRDSVQLTTVAPAADRTGAYADVASDGLHSYLIVAMDAAGNASTAAAVSGTADGVPPSVPLALAASLNGFSQIHLTWTQASADTENYRLYRATVPITTVAGLVPRSAVSPFIASPGADGNYRYVGTARDAAGNESALSNTATQNFDQAAPVIEITGVTNGRMSNQNLVIAFTVTDANLNPASITARLDGQPFASGSTGSQEGAHSLSITASDFESHSATVTVSFTLDKTAPVLAAGVADSVLLVGASSFTVLASDLHLATSSFLLVNDSLGSTVAYRSGDLISRDGAYRLILTAADAAGNVSARTISFTVDAAPGAPGSLAVVIGDTALLSWAAPEPDVVAYRVYRDGSRVSSSLHAGVSYEDVGYTSGAHVYEVSAVDARGFEGPKARANVPAMTLGLSAPTLTRGYFDALSVRAVNASGQALSVGPALAEVIAAGVVAASATANAVSVPAGQTATLTAVVATPVDLAASAAVRLTLALPTDVGAAVSLTRLFSVMAAEPQQPLIEALPDVLLAGGLSPVRVRLYNRGSASMDVMTARIENSTTAAVDAVTVRLKTPDGTVLAAAGIKQTVGASITLISGWQVYFVTVPPGGSLLTEPVLVPVPDSASGSLSVSAVVSTPTYDLGFVRAPGRRSFASAVSQAVARQLPYRALVSPQSPFYDQGSSVTLTGTAFDSLNVPATNSQVAVRILSEGFDRRLFALTNASGAFTTVFNPLLMRRASTRSPPSTRRPSRARRKRRSRSWASTSASRASTCRSRRTAHTASRRSSRTPAPRRWRLWPSARRRCPGGG
ncbi:MAG: Ig-like domain-containing protein [Elusimicrobiota bacterium]